MEKRSATYVDDPALVAERLRDARERAGLTQADLAFAGCSPGYISRIEAGQRVPSLQVLRELATRLGVSETFLATGAEDEAVYRSVLADADVALRLGELEQARSKYETVLRQAEEMPAGGARDRLVGDALEGLGHIAVAAGQPRDAIDRYERANEVVNGNIMDRPRRIEALARAHATVGELAPAIALLERALAEVEENGDPIQYIRFAALLGYALTDSGDFQRAEQVVARALDVGRNVTDPYSRARLYWSQSKLLVEQGKSDLAERHAAKAIETLRVTEDQYALGHAHQVLAHVYLDLGRADEAARTLETGWQLIAATATPTEAAHYRIDEARALVALERHGEAKALTMAAIEELGDTQPVEVGRAHLLLGEIAEQRREYREARTSYACAVRILEAQPANRYLFEAYQRLARLLKEEQCTDEAFEILERAVKATGAVRRSVSTLAPRNRGS